MNERIDNLLLGLDENELIEVPALACRVHRQIVDPLLFLQARAASAGFDLAVASSYRSFERQLLIWNNKVRGLRPVLNDKGEAIDINRLTDRDKVFAILRWSALPGASRHHWGSDIDVYDRSAIDANYQLQLTLEETQTGGPFAAFHRWLSDELILGNSGFFRPYALDKGGIAPEPWHLSYAPLAQEFSRRFTPDILLRQLEQAELELKQVVCDNLDEIYQRFICVE
ncbi:MAG TPA: M15 family metallopeptidase [Cellvibrio sp.]|nr:M15 family metallopeptidase [Cellvibrio sp.]